MKKLPHHAHTQEEIIGTYGETLPIQAIPQIDWQRMAAETWTQFLAQLGTLTPAQVKIVIDTWSKLVDPAALGDLMGEIVKVGTGTLKWLSDFFTGYNTSNPKLDIDKLNIIPYKLPTSAYNHILNPSYEYGAWGGSDTQSEDYAKFGKYSGKLVAAGSDVDGGWSNYIDVRGLTEQTINVWMKVTSRTAGLFQCWLEYYDSSKVYITDTMIKIGELNAVTDWTQKTLTDSDLPSGACFARVRNVWRDTPTGIGYVDGWQLNVGNQTPAFQDFTGYSFKFMPERIETTATTEQAWSSDQLTDILTLNFECESTMLLLIHAYCYGRIVNPTGSSGEAFRYHELAIDGNIKNTTFGGLGGYCISGGGKHAVPYECHHIEIVEKGSHTLTLKMASCCENHTAYANARRLTIIKSFYQGGAS